MPEVPFCASLILIDRSYFISLFGKRSHHEHNIGNRGVSLFSSERNHVIHMMETTHKNTYYTKRSKSKGIVKTLEEQ